MYELFLLKFEIKIAMKTGKLFVTLSLTIFCIQMNAQVKVIPNGKVGIGTNNPQYGLLEIGKSGMNNGLAIYDNVSNLPALRFYTSGKYAFLNFGTITSGLVMRPDGRLIIGAATLPEYADDSFLNLYIHPSNPAAAITVYSDPGYDFGDAIKVYSKRHTDVAYVVRDLSTGPDIMTFYVNGDGSVFSKGSFLTASDESFKDNITSISNGLNVIKKMRGVTYKVKEQLDDSVGVNSLNVSSLDTISSRSPVPVEIIDRIKKEKKRKKAGFIAQELEEVFPEAVYTLADGKKAVAYSEIIPLLVEAIKEQQKEIDELKQSRVVQTRTSFDDEPEQPDTNSLMDYKLKGKLYSNIPNPFKEHTTIAFFIPETASSASIHIFNLQGNQIKQIRIDEKGNSSVVINGYELNPGMYMYTLIVDGKEIGTKKMILTE